MYLVNIFFYSLIYYSHNLYGKFIINNNNLNYLKISVLKSINFPLVKIDNNNYKTFHHFNSNRCTCKKCIKKPNLNY